MTPRIAALALALVALAGCRRAHQVGDHVLVDWRGGEYPAVIVAVEKPSRFHVHYDGFSEDWDEIIPATRIRGRLDATPGPASSGAPVAKTRPRASASSSAAPPPPSVYRLGDRVRVEWHGSIYPGTVINVLGEDRYRVHYDGHGSQWDEDVPLNRIQRKSTN